jgi:glycosyltransferase involved in cell wall biosynthesis
MGYPKKLKICYIVPEVNLNTDTHFYEKYELLNAIRDRAVVMVLTTQGNVVVIFCKILAARLLGYRDFYVHYSFKGAILAWFIAKFSWGRVFYWNCGMPWLYKRSTREEQVFRFIMHNTQLVTGTKGMADAYIEQYALRKENVHVVPNWVNIARFQKLASQEDAKVALNIDPEKKVVLFLHHLSRRKGAHMLLPIIRQFKDAPYVLFLIVGSGPYQEKLQKEVVNHGLEQIVRIEGSVPNKKVPHYLAASDVYLMPSEEEGFPNALLEAMAAGVAFVASNVGGVKEVTPPETQHYILSHDDAYSFYLKLDELLANASLRHRLGRIEQEWVKRYDIEAVAPAFLHLFIHRK